MKLDQVCFRLTGKKDPQKLATYESIGGYSSLRRICEQQLKPKDIVEEIKVSALRGRGGAGFPTGLKWSFIPATTEGQKYILCNADEGEPGTFKDRDIIRYNPHQLIEGMIIAGYSMGASVGYVYMRGEFFEPGSILEAALEEAYAAKFLGNNILNSSFNFDLYVFYGAGAYICGEETSLMESLEGKRGLPRFKPPFPANYGLYGKPTTINNVETLATIPVIMEKSGKWHLNEGKENNGGYKIFSVSGHVNKPGNYEIPLGTPFMDLLKLAGGVRKGHKLKAVIPGGSSVPVLPSEIISKVNMDYDSIAKAGSMLGAGSVIVMDETTDMVAVLRRLSYFYYEESCGQCTPCREGTGWLYRMLTRIINGEGSLKDIESLQRVADNIAGRTICALGDAAAMPVQSFLKHFKDEFVAYVS